MSEPLYKEVNVLDPKTRRPLRDRKTGKLVSRRVRMTDEEAAAFLAEQAEAERRLAENQ